MYSNNITGRVYCVIGLGGATVFPLLNFSYALNPGEALLWVNSRPDGSMEKSTVHGGCPVADGEKSISVIWIRERHQEFALRCGKNEERFDISSFHRGSVAEIWEIDQEKCF